MQALRCTQHGGDFDTQQAIEHVRRFHASFIKRAGRLGEFDTHDHMWYCFRCGSDFKDHRSYDSDDAMWAHLLQKHDFDVDCMVSF